MDAAKSLSKLPSAFNRAIRRDVIELTLDFSPRIWAGERECAGKMSIYRGPILLAYDPRFDAYACDEAPPLDASKLNGQQVALPGAPSPSPMLLTKFTSEDGRMVTLCDFASAGATGTPYRSWLLMSTNT